MLVRWPHMLLAAFLTTGMCVTATGAWYVLRDVHRAEGRVMLHWGLGLVAVLIPVQLFFGHLTGLYVLSISRPSSRRSKPAGRPQQPASEVLIAIPDRDERTQSVRDRSAEARQLHRVGHLGFARESGSTRFRHEDRPPVVIPFFASGSWSAWG